jgi:hypothetical protein
VKAVSLLHTDRTGTHDSRKLSQVFAGREPFFSLRALIRQLFQSDFVYAVSSQPRQRVTLPFLIVK